MFPVLSQPREVHKLYADGSEHEYKSTELITMNRDEFLKKVLDDNSINMPGCHRGGVALLRGYIKIKMTKF